METGGSVTEYTIEQITGQATGQTSGQTDNVTVVPQAPPFADLGGGSQESGMNGGCEWYAGSLQAPPLNHPW